MCGIVGQINSSSSIDYELFDEMTDTLKHRGPDDRGSILLHDKRVALGHRRLSIIDLTRDGHQPMSNEDKSIWLTFNGEIYNYQSIKNELIKTGGHEFRSNSDSEVLIHGYEQWGIEGLLNRINGMFAFGIWDEANKILVLARDRFGIKPLYYSLFNRTFVFASELKAINRHPDFPREINWAGVLDFIVHRFIPNPKSVWKDCYKLEPAHYLIINQDLEIQAKEQYWSLYSEYQVRKPELLVEEFSDLLMDSVTEHLVSDVPVGVFLSGGYDSSAMLHYISRLGYSTNSYTIGFDNWDKSEHRAASRISGVYGTNHHEKLIDFNDIEGVSQLSYFYDEPQGGSSFMPTYEVCQLASKDLKVVISGDGGDELMAGYSWHNHIMNLISGGFMSAFRRTLKKDLLVTEYWKYLSWTGLDHKGANNLLNNPLNDSDVDSDPLALYKAKLNREEPFLKQLQRLDISCYLTDVFLPKLDRASMANSLEVRVPFLDHRLMEFVFKLDPRCYFDPKASKPLLRKILSSALPQEILNRPKQGFGSPIFGNEIVENISTYLDRSAMMNQGLVNRSIFEQLRVNRDVKKLWALYLLNNWYDRWK